MVLVTSTYAINLCCLIKNAVWGGGNISTCFATNVTESNSTVSEEEQEELNINPDDLNAANKTEEDLEGIHIKDHKLPCFPKRMYRRFRRLQAIEFDNSQLETVTDEDFRGLLNLRYVSCPRNKFKMLPGRLFRFTPNLQWVKFHGNSLLKHIGFNLFKHLRKLKEVNLGQTGCTNTTVTDTTSVATTTGDLLSECPPDPKDLEEDMNNLECEWVEGDVVTTTGTNVPSTTTTTTVYQTTTSIIYG
ncbi:hypothetical protein PVAND_015354 [Polypedilum vanderplanki]|uniref:Uncharacterized protein n=1 Tax=Polypedilum vanderplanki TaxID=319348 RepID=A0A9J6BC10_POLVA|nr:hypothetical protein PVAND_015354 [Polypedilum vanderplanki]